MTNVIVVGSGPVGSFIAVLCAQLNFSVTVYEKREGFIRNINVKIESDFFKTVQEVLTQLNVKSNFFAELNECLQSQRNKIQIKELENRFASEAKSLGAKYIIREVESFEELYEEHKDTHPIILDCTGRNSKLRINQFGPDEDNIDSAPLQHAMYVNFKVKVINNLSSLYQVMKYINNIKLTRVVLAKCKDEYGYSDVTLPVFITDELAHCFDKEYPNINREPLNPFNSLQPVPDNIFFPLSSLLGNFIVDGCDIDFKSVKVKKIEISCGYAKKRSEGKFICLGDSVIHLAFFRSLNLGLKHALQFFIKLSMLQSSVLPPEDDEIIRQFKKQRPHLHPVEVYPTIARNVYLVVTKVVWYGCFSYCLTNHEVGRLTCVLGVNGSQIGDILEELNEKLRSWNNSLADFEAKRDEDIRNEINSNQTKNSLYDYVSWFIDINGKSFIKISELARAARGKYPLYLKDFNFLFNCFKIRREVIASGKINIIRNLLNQSEDREFHELKEICDRGELSDEEKVKIVDKTINSKLKRTNSGSKAIKDSSYENVRSHFISALIKNEIAQ